LGQLLIDYEQIVDEKDAADRDVDNLNGLLDKLENLLGIKMSEVAQNDFADLKKLLKGHSLKKFIKEVRNLLRDKELEINVVRHTFQLQTEQYEKVAQLVSEEKAKNRRFQEMFRLNRVASEQKFAELIETERNLRQESSSLREELTDKERN
jgi:hypothetical protein